MADMKLNFDDVSVKVAEFLGEGSTATTKSKDITYRGYRNFLNPIDVQNGQPYHWSFLKKYDTIVTIGNQWKYPLPNDYANVEIGFIHDTQSGYPQIEKVSAEAILQKRKFSTNSCYPTSFAITTGTYTKETGSKYEAWFHGVPNGVYIIPYWYIFEPEEPSETTDMFVGNVFASEAILEAALAVAETQEDDVVGIHSQLANEAIQRLIRVHKGTESNKLGKLIGGEEVTHRRFLESLGENDIYA